MKRFIVGSLAIIGGMVVVLIGVVMVIGLVTGTGKGKIAARTILEADFEQPLREYESADPVLKLLQGEQTATVRGVVEALQQAAQDDRVVAFIARIGAAGVGMAQIQEVRDAVLAFRESGKRAIAYAETFGEFGPGNGAYYLASAFDTIYLQPSGDVGLTGLVFESPFLQGAFEKLAITPRMDHRKEYKNFMNVFTERAYTAPHREAIERVMMSQFDQIVRAIAVSRGISEEAVRAFVDGGPLLGKEAIEAQLVDKLAYRDEVYAQVKADVGHDAKLLYLSTYLARAGRPHTTGDTVALIYGVGGVQRGKSSYDPMFGSPTMGADTITAAFRTALRDKTVKAILFRVDSPGGSYVASDAIWRETVRAQKADKPVIVSMGNVAGSGGYFVAMNADKIVAQPGTITGSIGVLGGKMLTTGFWDKLGLSWDEVHTSTHATMWSGTQDYTPEQWQRVQAWLDRVYEDFTAKAAEGRGLTREHMAAVAKGRIWTGEDAKTHGLVDELGGFPVALRLVRESLGLDADAPIKLQLFPKPQSTFEAFAARLFGKSGESSEAQATAVVLQRTLQLIRPMARLIRHLGRDAAPGALVMPEFKAGD